LAKVKPKAKLYKMQLPVRIRCSSNGVINYRWERNYKKS